VATTRKSYLEELARIQEQMNTLLEKALLRSGYDQAEGSFPGTWAPAVDIVETEDAYLLYAELPGVTRQDFDLEVRPRQIELSGHRQRLPEGSNFLRLERNYGRFQRSFELAEPVDSEAVKVDFRQGVLAIVAPKKGAGKRRTGK
jgi:HSP20 family protein